ncbi:hypothetical protein SOVF_150290 [Spinacia oleracea]|uniref:Transcription repressor n=1 Tax=Spinacia oleracea TaxID=3562 RepID=A0A9R0JI15_SPIOL|nr:transcription repressor OFP6-like [Spinacia oleracea]KNA09798.1 hypothetical protein SOVF_150290 [Spinacia oleracea]
MSSTKRKVLLNTVSVNLGCSCRRPKLSSFFNPKPKSKTPNKYQKHHNYSYSSSTSSNTANSRNMSSSSPYECYYPTINSATFSPYMDTTTTTTTSSSSSSHPSSSSVDGFGFKSVAEEKDSNDPYLDFRQSMLQMIMENQIYTKDDLKHLLNCFLQLNSPSLHGTIIRVFTEIWNSFFFNGRPDHTSPSYFLRPKSYQF